MSAILTRPSDTRATAAFAVVVVAAGASRRLGQPKALVRRSGMSLVALQVRRAECAGAAWIGVTVGSRQGRLLNALRSLPAEPIRVHRWRQGMGESIAAAARAAPPLLPLLVVAVDQWRLRASDFKRLARGPIRETRAAAYAGVVGIPVCFSPADRKALRRLRGEQGARSQLRHATPVKLPRAAADLDTVADLVALRQSWPAYRRTPR